MGRDQRCATGTSSTSDTVKGANMDTAQLLVTILGAGGGGAAILALINGTFKWLTGAASRERNRNTDLVAQRLKAVEEKDAAENERDISDKKRREAYEYASQLRRQLIEHGIEPVLPSTVDDPNVPGPIVVNTQIPGLPEPDEEPLLKRKKPNMPTHPSSPYS
jgi:hypothetical protein